MILTFEFEMERGVVNAVDMVEEESGVLKKCLDLCVNGGHQDAASLLISHMSFEWDWDNCDGDISDFISDSKPINENLNPDNCSVKVGIEDEHLVITATVVFEYATDIDIDIEEFSEWLDENSAYACGFIACGAGYDGTDGDNVRIIKVDGRDVDL